jgi:hypothetical protein
MSVASIGDENDSCAPGHRTRKERHEVAASFQQTVFASEVRQRASTLPPGFERDELIRKARRADTASHIEKWVNSSGLQPPT